MIKTLFPALCLVLLFSFNLKAQDNKSFLGDWEVKLTGQSEDEFPWAEEIKYPVRFSITEENGKLVGSYTDQYKYSSKFSVLFVLENEIYFIHGGGKKHKNGLSPIHRAIFKDGVLHGFVFTNKKLFEWTAKKK